MCDVSERGTSLPLKIFSPWRHPAPPSSLRYPHSGWTGVPFLVFCPGKHKLLSQVLLPAPFGYTQERTEENVAGAPAPLTVWELVYFQKPQAAS